MPIYNLDNMSKAELERAIEASVNLPEVVERLRYELERRKSWKWRAERIGRLVRRWVR